MATEKLKANWEQGDYYDMGDVCPNTCGVACWEQYLKFRNGERKDNE